VTPLEVLPPGARSLVEHGGYSHNGLYR